MRQSLGGVGHNIAEGLTRLGCAPLFVSSIGEDMHAHTFFQHARQYGMVREKHQQSDIHASLVILCMRCEKVETTAAATEEEEEEEEECSVL